MHKRLPLSRFDIFTSFAPMVDMGFFIEHKEASFNKKTSKFSAANAWWLADCSRLAYVRDQKFVRKTLRHAGFTKVKFFDKKGTQCFVASNRQIVIVAFRGTEANKELTDLLADINAIPVSSDVAGYVHQGFKKALDLIWNDLTKYLDTFAKSKRTVWYTGHSLGAAIATLAAARRPGNGLYTFGSPRVGTKKFVKAMKTPTFRVANTHDIVTRIPPPIGFRHVGELKFIGADGVIRTNPNMWSRFYQRVGGGEWKILLLLFQIIISKSKIEFILSYLHDHSPYNYSVFMWNNI